MSNGLQPPSPPRRATVHEVWQSASLAALYGHTPQAPPPHPPDSSDMAVICSLNVNLKLIDKLDSMSATDDIIASFRHQKSGLDSMTTSVRPSVYSTLFPS